MRNSKIRILTEAAVMVALSTALSLITVFKLPWGGSITLLSMLPVCVFSVRRGIKNGMLASFVFSVIQLFIGITVDGMLGWGMTPIALIGCILLDYVVAYSVLGLAGIFGNGNVGSVIGGISVAVILRLCSHLLSGAVIFKSFGQIWNLDISNPWLYSLLYNGAYMVPELILTVAAAVVLFSVKGTRRLLCEGRDNSGHGM